MKLGFLIFPLRWKMEKSSFFCQCTPLISKGGSECLNPINGVPTQAIFHVWCLVKNQTTAIKGLYKNKQWNWKLCNTVVAISPRNQYFAHFASLKRSVVCSSKGHEGERAKKKKHWGNSESKGVESLALKSLRLHLYADEGYKTDSLKGAHSVVSVVCSFVF